MNKEYEVDEYDILIKGVNISNFKLNTFNERAVNEKGKIFLPVINEEKNRNKIIEYYSFAGYTCDAKNFVHYNIYLLMNYWFATLDDCFDTGEETTDNWINIIKQGRSPIDKPLHIMFNKWVELMVNLL